VRFASVYRQSRTSRRFTRRSSGCAARGPPAGAAAQPRRAQRATARAANRDQLPLLLGGARGERRHFGPGGKNERDRGSLTSTAWRCSSRSSWPRVGSPAPTRTARRLRDRTRGPHRRRRLARARRGRAREVVALRAARAQAAGRLSTDAQALQPPGAHPAVRRALVQARVRACVCRHRSEPQVDGRGAAGTAQRRDRGRVGLMASEALELNCGFVSACSRDARGAPLSSP